TTSWTRLTLDSFRSLATILTQAVYVFHRCYLALVHTSRYIITLVYYVLNIALYIYFLLFRGHRMKFTRN
ncbi:hypothetical protein B0H11DRAFT_1993533, partial [Mycena galericulata]